MICAYHDAIRCAWVVVLLQAFDEFPIVGMDEGMCVFAKFTPSPYTFPFMASKQLDVPSELTVCSHIRPSCLSVALTALCVARADDITRGAGITHPPENRFGKRGEVSDSQVWSLDGGWEPMGISNELPERHCSWITDTEVPSGEQW